MRASSRWLVYALGGGLGHLTRAAALARVAARRGHLVSLVTNSPFAPGLPMEPLLGPGVTVHRLDAAWDKPAVVAEVTRLWTAAPWDVLVVDTFPRGLAGELPPLLASTRALSVLVHRDLNPEYVARFPLAQAVDAFALLLVPGEPAPFAAHPRAVRTAPWLLLEREALLSREAARRELGAEGDARPLVVVAGCGRVEEVEEMGRLSARLEAGLGARARVRWVVPPGFTSHGAALPVWPLLALLPGVDVLVGAGGYNTVREARATGTPLVALARARRYDRQAARLRPEERVADAEAVWARVQELLPPRSRLPAEADAFRGAHTAVEHIERALLSA
ncbi:hypothetical protein DRW03_16745 [Corallococcus sp. H22C18031201]|nr:hypothetical protein DRW03_16745 [Corallococcus sp. H22C18031201]